MSEPHRDDHRVADQNIERLIERAYQPVSMSTTFSHALRLRLGHEQQRVARSRRRPALAAAALLVLVTAASLLVPFERRDQAWQVRGDARVLRPGSTTWVPANSRNITAEETRIATRNGRATLIRGNARITLEEYSEIIAKESGEIVYQRGTLDVEATETLRIDLPWGHIRPTGSRTTHVRIREGAPSMNRTAVAAAVTTVAAVTIFVLARPNDTTEGPGAIDSSGVTIETAAGDRQTLGEGESAVVSENGVERSGSSLAGTGSGNSGSSMSAGALSDPLAEPSRRLEVRVIDSESRPVEGAAVSFIVDLSDSSDRDEDDNTPNSTRGSTDETGLATLVVPLDTGGAISVVANRFLEGEVLWWAPEADGDETAAGDSASDDSAAETPIAPNDLPTSTIEIQLIEEPAIEGRVVDIQSGDGRTEFLISTQQYFDEFRRDEPRLHSVTSEDGSYRIGGLRPGRYIVAAYEAGFIRTETQRVEIADGVVARNTDFRLEPGSRLRGRVYDKISGSPISGALVYPPLEHLQGSVNYVERTDLDDGVRNAAKTDAAGRFELDDLPEGRLVVRALHRDYAPMDATVQVERGTVSDVEIALSEGSSVRGRVVLGGGESAAGYQVVAVEMKPNPSMSGLTMTSVTSAGTYEVKNLASGMHVVALVPGDATVEDGGENIQFTMVPEGGEAIVDFILASTKAVLLGRVLDVSGDPVPQASVMLVRQDGDQSEEFNFESTTCNADGEYRLSNLDPGTYQVSLTAPGSQNFAVVGKVEISDPVDVEKDWTLQDHSVEAIVVDSDGKPVRAAEVILLRTAGTDNFAGRGLTNADGQTTIKGLAPESYRLWVRAEGMRTTTTDLFEIEEDENAPITMEVTLLRAAEVKITVVDARKVPIAGALVQITDVERGVPANPGLPPVTGAGGLYEYRSLVPAQYRVTASFEGRIGSATFTASEGRVATLTVTLPDPE